MQELEQLGEKVERTSRQNKLDPNTFFTSTYQWVKKMEMNEPPWGSVRGEWVDNRVRDDWLMKMARAEPHLGSILSTAVVMDANRQYKLVGGRNQLRRVLNTFDNFDGGAGFRSLQEANAYNYYTADVGAPVEIETEGKNGRLLNLYSTDPTHIRLGKKGSLKFGASDIWKPDTYYRLASQKTTQYKYNKLGFSSLSRCVKLAQTMIAIVEHNLEKLGHIAPKGILFIQAEDLTSDAWAEAMEGRKAVYVNNTGNQYYDEVTVIVDRLAKGELLSLSQMPDRFDTFMFTDYMIKAYALAFNRDVRAFWSLNSGNFGGGTEAQLQSEKATYGGAAEFVLASQEQIQRLLPDSVLFEYEVDDTRGKLQKAEVDRLLIEAAETLTKIGMTPQKAIQWLVERGVLPGEWTDELENDVAKNGVMIDRQSILKQRFLLSDNVITAIENRPDDPVFMYESPSALYPSGRSVKLWENKDDAFGKSWLVKREVEVQEYSADTFSPGNLMFVLALIAYLEALENPTGDETELLDDLMIIANEGLYTDDTIVSLQERVNPLIPVAVLTALLILLQKSREAKGDSITAFPGRWQSRLDYFRNLGMLIGTAPEERFTWYYGDTITHCNDCQEFHLTTKSAAEWLEGGLLPQDINLSCFGLNCRCTLVKENNDN